MKTSFIKAQKNEITEYYIYKKLAKQAESENNKEILTKIANQEKKHYNFWKKKTNQEVKPSRLQIWGYLFLTKIFGMNFGLSLMESGEKLTQKVYDDLEDETKLKEIIKEEQQHEEKLLQMIDEKKLEYTSSIVLGLNDALVELTGALAGLTLALKDTQLIAIVGLITGIAASLSMAGSEYLSTKEEKEGVKNPLQAGTITGISYFSAVVLLILPYFLLSSPLISLGITILVVIGIILSFSFYTSTINKKVSFKDKVIEMAIISLGVAAINFVIGHLIRTYFGVDV
ncbi:MAG: rubrerythrin family protein [Parcubacteria group bacterium QH_9_35_7]|nr:MAG: rubrerythrin family protein [Parcubacteria group bacterium QH_9_35_7]